MPDATDEAFFEFEAAGPDRSSSIDGSIRIFKAAPFILRDPVDMTSQPGGRAFFSAEFSGAPSQTQWVKDGPTPLASSENLELTSVQPENQGSYWLYVENEIGEAWSQPAFLTVGTPTRYRDWILSEQGSLAFNGGRGNPLQSFVGDQTPNLIKWAMGLSLAEPTTGASIRNLSQADGLVFSFPVALSPLDVDFTVERSVNLHVDSWEAIARRPAGGSWSTLDENFQIEEILSESVSKVRVHDLSNKASGFFRVRVELTEDSQTSVDF